MFNQREGGDPVSIEIKVLEAGLGFSVQATEVSLG
jgi:hypothetical protein